MYSFQGCLTICLLLALSCSVPFQETGFSGQVLSSQSTSVKIRGGYIGTIKYCVPVISKNCEPCLALEIPF